MRYNGQVAIVTGASSGIGSELARVLASEGAKVGLIARRRESLEQLTEEITRAGGVAKWATADVADRQQVLTAVGELEAALGPTDLMLANAGVGAPTTLEPFNVGDFEKMYRVNVFGVVYSFEAVLPGMLARKKGHLAAVSSMAGYRGLPGEWGYTSSKAAVNNLMVGLRIQLRDRGITVTNICPGFVRTPMTANNKFHMPWLVEPDDAARRIVRALARKKSWFDFPWQMTWFMAVVCRLPDWLIARQMKIYNENPPWPDKPL